MGDYAVNIAKLAQQLAAEPETPMLPQIPQMAQICREQLSRRDARAGRHLRGGGARRLRPRR